MYQEHILSSVQFHILYSQLVLFVPIVILHSLPPLFPSFLPFLSPQIFRVLHSPHTRTYKHRSSANSSRKTQLFSYYASIITSIQYMTLVANFYAAACFN